MSKRRLRRRYGRASTNVEGMTLGEWTRAANAFDQVIEGAAARKAWHNGEDPTEYAALAHRGLKVHLEPGGRLVARPKGYRR